LFVVALLTAIAAVLWVFLSRKGSQTENSTRPASTVMNSASGTPVPLDQQRKLAEQGDAAVQFAIGARYAIGDEVSKYRVSILASRMSHPQLVAVQEQANQWLKNHQVAKSH